MLKMTSLRDEKTLTIGLFLLLGFVYLTMGTQISIIFLIMISSYGFLVLRNKAPIQFIRKIDSKSLFYILLFLIIEIAITMYAANILNISSVSSLAELGQMIYADTNFEMFSNTLVPEWANSNFVTVFIWGICFPIFETLGLLALSMTVFGRLLNINISSGIKRITLKHIWFIMLVGVSCSLWHLVARQGQDFALFVDVVFFSVSAFLVLKTRQLFEAFGIHLLHNLLVLFVSGILILGGSVL